VRREAGLDQIVQGRYNDLCGIQAAGSQKAYGAARLFQAGGGMLAVVQILLAAAVRNVLRHVMEARYALVSSDHIARAGM
jgi:hypothetical protein